MINEVHIVPNEDAGIVHIAEHNCPCGVQCGIKDNQIVYVHFNAEERALAKVG